MTSDDPFSILFSRVKIFIFKKIIAKRKSIFMVGNDLISRAILLDGMYEPALTKLISFFSTQGFSGFFIDIGANIGVSSCQNGDDFECLYCVEPNPLCVHILKVNLEINLHKSRYSIIECALGGGAGESEIFVPKHNWGGAFINSNENGYSEEILASKDGFGEISKENYHVRKIKVLPAFDVLERIFSELSDRDSKKGVIKIDVEGFEHIILSGIAKALPPDFSVAICFENWDKDFSFMELYDFFSGRHIEIKIIDNYWTGSSQNVFFKFITAIFGGRKVANYRPLSETRSKTGDVVIELFDAA